MQFVREVARLNGAFRFDCVLYFLPFREPPKRAEGNFIEELEVLYFYFGNSIFEHMIMIATNSKMAQRDAVRCASDSEDDRKFSRKESIRKARYICFESSD